MKDSEKRPSFFEVRWEIFVTAELCRQVEDTEYLRQVQRSIVDNELRRINAATEAARVSQPDLKKR